MKRVFVDTNIFIRYLTNDPRDLADKVERFFDLAQQGEIWLVTGPPVLFEVAWTLKSFYKMTRERIYECLTAILGIPGLEVSDIGVMEEALELYKKPLQAENWDRALWEFTLASRPGGLAKRLGELNLPTLVISGDDDRIVPTEDSIRLAGELPKAELVVIPDAGHVPHEERPDQFLQAVKAFLDSLLQS